MSLYVILPGMNNFFYQIIIILLTFVSSLVAQEDTHSSCQNLTTVWSVISVGLVGTLFGMYKKYIDSYKKLKEENQLLKEKEEELSYLATTDYLTQLYNRRYCIETGEKLFQLAKRNERPLSVIIFDIDDFKQVNDTYGHKVGDAVLVSLGIKLS